MTDDDPVDRPRLDDLGVRIDRVLRELAALDSSDPAASRSLHAVRLVEHTLRCHAAGLVARD